MVDCSLGSSKDSGKDGLLCQEVHGGKPSGRLAAEDHHQSEKGGHLSEWQFSM